MTATKCFSYFRAPIQNTCPAKTLTLAEVYAYITSTAAKTATEQLRQLKDVAEARKYKSFHFDFCTFSGTFTQRKAQCIEQHSGLICLDFDHVGNVDNLKNSLLADPHFVTRLAFRSPSGDGLKWIIDCELDSSISHADYFIAVSAYLRDTYTIEPDQSGKDVCRSCFLPYDPQAYMCDDDAKAAITPFLPFEWLTGQDTKDALSDRIEALANEIEKSAIDITAGYDNWLKIGFALADALGEQGRFLFHRISQFNADYNRQVADIQYDKCINSKSDGITWRSLFYIAREKGIRLTEYNRPSQTAKTAVPSNLSINLTKTSDIPNEVIEVFKEIEGMSGHKSYIDPFSSQLDKSSLPVILQQVISHANSPADADMLLLGSLVCLSSCMPHVCGIYLQKLSYANLYCFIYAHASAGKGRLTLCKNLVQPIQDQLYNEYNKKLKAYYLELKETGKTPISDDGETIGEPPIRVLFIPANNTSTGVYNLLNNNGGSGLIFDTEGDTLTLALSSDHGKFSDGLRKAFHHESIAYNRKTNSEYVNIPEPRLSMLLSGTPQQLLSLIDSVENGLYSRFIFFRLETDLQWRNVFEGDNLDPVFLRLGDEFQMLYRQLNSHKGMIQFSLTPEQQDIFNQSFSTMQTEIYSTFGEGILASFRRKGLIAYRIAMILSVLRLSSDQALPSRIVCSDADFKSAMIIIKTLLQHDTLLIKTYPQLLAHVPNPLKVQKQRNLYSYLPHEFDKQQWNKCAAMANINLKTAERYLKTWCERGLLMHIEQDHYVKTNHYKDE